MSRPFVFVFNGWAASPHAWDLCRFMRSCGRLGDATESVTATGAALPRVFSYVEQLDGEPEKAMEGVDRCILVGWSMGGSSALRLAARWPEKIAGLVLIAATPRMMEEKETGWKGMSPRRLEALRYGLVMTRGEGFFGVPEGRPNPYMTDTEENLSRGLDYLRATDLRSQLQSRRQAFQAFPVEIFQSERDGIVRVPNADFLMDVFPHAHLHIVPGTEHALPVAIPQQIDAAVLSLQGK